MPTVIYILINANSILKVIMGKQFYILNHQTMLEKSFSQNYLHVAVRLYLIVQGYNWKL